MSDDHAPAGDIRRSLWQRLRDVFIGQPVKAVAPDTLGVELLWNGIMIRKRVMVAMKCGIEAGDLRQRGTIIQQ